MLVMKMIAFYCERCMIYIYIDMLMGQSIEAFSVKIVGKHSNDY